MDIAVVLSWLLGLAVLLPLGSFVLIFLFGNHMGKGGKQASVCATGAILSSCILSMIALVIWLNHHPPGGHGSHGDARPSIRLSLIVAAGLVVVFGLIPMAIMRQYDLAKAVASRVFGAE